MNKEVRFMLSLCQKAGKAVTGEDACLTAISSGQGKLILIASDASDNTKKRFENKAVYYKVPVKTIGGRDEMSSAIGKENRPVIVITDQGLSEKILKLLEG